MTDTITDQFVGVETTDAEPIHSADLSIKASFAAAVPHQTEEPRPLQRAARLGQPFPTDALGPEIAAVARAAHEIVQIPEAMCAQSVLAVMALAVQAHANVSLGKHGSAPTCLFLLSVGGSGERKSTLDKLLCKAVREREEELAVEWRQAKARYTNEKEAWDLARSRKKAELKGADVEDLTAALEAIGPEPTPAKLPMILVPEPTPQGLQKLFQFGQSSIGMFNDEAGDFVGGYAMSKDNELATAAQLSKLWDGAPVRRVRGGDDFLFLPGRRMSMHLMLQRRAAAIWLGNETLRDQGMFSRLLIAAPASLVGQRFVSEVPDSLHAIMDTFGVRTLALLRKAPPHNPDAPDELRPRLLPLTSDALARLDAFYNRVEAEVGPCGRYEAVTPLANKAREHAARLAAVLALFDNIDVPALDARAIERGIVLAQWYLEEALRLTEEGTVPPDVARAEELLRWLTTVWVPKVEPMSKLVSLPDIYQRGPQSIRLQAVAKAAADVLVDHGHLRVEDGGGVVGGRFRRSGIYKVVI